MEKTSKNDDQLNRIMMDNAKQAVTGKRSDQEKKRMISGTFLPVRPPYQGDFTKKWKEN